MPGILCVGEGFSPNLMWLLHAYPLYGAMNGTFYVDSKLWPHRCTEAGGGWGDFFSDADVVDWSADKERAAGEVCLRQGSRQVDELLHKLGTGTEELDGMAVNRVSAFPSLKPLQATTLPICVVL